MAKVFEAVLSRAQTLFINESLIYFSRAENQRAQREALDQVKS